MDITPYIDFLNEYQEVLTRSFDATNPKQVQDYFNDLNPQRSQFFSFHALIKTEYEKSQIQILNTIDVKSETWIRIKNSSTLVDKYLRTQTPLAEVFQRAESLMNLTNYMSREVTTLLAYMRHAN
jgi:hypothetical protein